MKTDYLIIIVGMAAVTYFPRFIPLLVLTRRQLPQWLIEWLDLIPASILSALIFPALLAEGDPRHMEWIRPHLFAALPTFVFAALTKSLAGTVVVGMAAFWLIEKFI